MSNYTLKYSPDVQELYFDFSTILDPSEFISPESVQITFVKDISGDIVIEEDTINILSKSVSVHISGGSPGLNPQIKCSASTTNGLAYSCIVDVLVWGEGV